MRGVVRWVLLSAAVIAVSLSGCSAGDGSAGGGSGSSGGGSASSGGGSGSSGGGSASSGGGSASSGGGSGSSGGGSASSGGGSASSGGGSASSGGGSASSGGGSGSSGGGSASSGGGSASSGGGMADAGQACTTLDAGIAPDVAVTTVLTPAPVETGGVIAPGTYVATAIIDHYPDGGMAAPDNTASERNVFILDATLTGPYAAVTNKVDGGRSYSVSTVHFVPGDGGIDSPTNAVLMDFTCPFRFGFPVFYSSDGGAISMSLDERQILYTRQ